MSALGLATLYNALATERLLSRGQMDRARISQVGFDADPRSLVLSEEIYAALGIIDDPSSAESSSRGGEVSIH